MGVGMGMEATAWSLRQRIYLKVSERGLPLERRYAAIRSQPCHIELCRALWRAGEDIACSLVLCVRDGDREGLVVRVYADGGVDGEGVGGGRSEEDSEVPGGGKGGGVRVVGYGWWG